MKDLALHILDIAQNSVSAGATIVRVIIIGDRQNDVLTLTITDNGRGMSNEQLSRVTDPYFTTRTTRKVGMGIPLLKHTAEQAGGTFAVSSAADKGTELTATMCYSHLDRPPMGDIAGVISMLAGANPVIDFICRYENDGSAYTFDTREIKEILEDVPLSEPAVIRYLKELIEENISAIAKAGKP